MDVMDMTMDVMDITMDIKTQYFYTFPLCEPRFQQGDFLFHPEEITQSHSFGAFQTLEMLSILIIALSA